MGTATGSLGILKWWLRIMNQDLIQVSKKWSMGRVVDSLAATLGVENRNNVAGADKLLIFRVGDGMSLCGDMSEPVESLLQREEMFNGDSVVLEYVPEGVEQLE